MAENSADPLATATNIARLLQTLDQDGNSENGILISSDIAVSAPVLNFDVSVAEFESKAEVINLVANSGSPMTTLIDADTAIAHLNATVSATQNTDNNTNFSVELLNNRFLIPTPEFLAAGKSAFRMDAGDNLRIAGLVNGGLGYGKFPWTVSDEGVLEVDLNDFEEGFQLYYTPVGTDGEKIILSERVAGSDDAPVSFEYYLSKPLSAADFAGKNITISGDDPASIAFNQSGAAVLSFNDGTMMTGSYEDISVQGVGLSGADFFQQMVLANGSLEDGLIMVWLYDMSDYFTTLYYFKSNGSSWTQISKLSR